MLSLIIDSDAAATNGSRHSLGCSMQQEWPSVSIMTSRRRLLALGLSALMNAGFLAGCAALPDDAPVTEQLDEETGITVARLGRPIEVYRETFRGNTAGKFSFVGPFETNSMGARQQYF